MERRDFLTVLSGMAGVVAAGSANAAEPAVDHSQHHHHATAYPPIASTAADCIKTGQVCIDHCLSLLGGGDASLAGCARSVQQMLPVCSALQQLGAQNSTYLAGLAKVALQACKDCEKECRKHEAKHAQCKDCADACAACAKECEKIAA